MQNLMKNKTSKNSGITLMALVITIIILLILAGISLNMLAGNNGVINHAGKAKNQTENAEEKEILEIATLNVIGKNKYGNIEEEKLKEALSNEDVTIKKSGKNFNVTFNKSSRKYKIKSNGDIKYYEEIPATDIYAKLESDGTLKLRATKLDGYEKGTKWNSPDILKVVIEEPIAPKSCSSMFDSCTNLTSFENIENLHTENATSMYYMFFDCKKLETLDVSNFDTGKVTTIRAMFKNCSKLKELDLSNFDTKNISKTMFEFFSGCSSLTSLDLSGFDTKNVPDMAWMFRNCSNLSSVNLSNLDTSNCVDLTYMFGGCGSLKTIDVSSFDTSKVKEMGMMFNGCWRLVNVDLSNFDTQNVTNMNAMFRSCGNLLNASLNSMLNMCKKATKISDKTLTYVEVPKAKALLCNTLDNYSSFVESGWSIGY